MTFSEGMLLVLVLLPLIAAVALWSDSREMRLLRRRREAFKRYTDMIDKDLK